MFERRKIKCCILLVLIVMVVLHLHLGYFCGERDCALTTEASNPERYLGNGVSYPGRTINYHSNVHDHHDGSKITSLCETTQDLPSDGFLQGMVLFQNMSTADMDRPYRFDLEGQEDVLVFLHMQKTGGTTFGRHLINNLQMAKPCSCHQSRKKCDCKNSRDLVWLVSRYSTGWRCGLHADWTELTTCVDGMLNKIEGIHRHRRYMYITILRDPYTRYLSEYKHVQRGATWKAVRLQCNGRQASLQEVPFCFEGDDWRGVSLGDFMDCQHNLATNRQTRMMANLSVVGCYNHFIQSEHQWRCRMLQSAKDNLRKLAFFGLTEYQLETQYMFERTFGLKFKTDFFQYNHTHSSEVTISSDHRRKILQLNDLDVELYRYAKGLFFKRLHKLLEEDTDLRTVNVKFQNRDNVGDNRIYLNRGSEDYEEEEDENEVDDDNEYNGRIAPKYTRLKRTLNSHTRFPFLREYLDERDRSKYKPQRSLS